MSNICKSCGGVDNRPTIENVETTENGKRFITPTLRCPPLQFIKPNTKLCICDPEISFKIFYKE